MKDVSIVVHLRGPLRAGYDPNLLDGTAPSLGVIVTNRSARALDVSDLRVHLEARRESVAFRCARQVGAPGGQREPTTLAPGASHVFARALDCPLPLVGAYAVRVAVSFGRGDFRAPRPVHAVGITVAALPSFAPREVDGLWAAMGSSSGAAGDDDARPGGGRRVLVTIVNPTPKPIDVPRMHLALRVYRVGQPIPCEDQPLELHPPPTLGPHDTYDEPIAVSCLGLAVPGTYDVAAWLILPRGEEGDRAIALGRLRVEVAGEPTRPGTPTAE